MTGGGEARAAMQSNFSRRRGLGSRLQSSLMRNAPFRPGLEKMAQTWVYESTIMGALLPGLLPSVRVPTLVIDGETSPEGMRQAAQSLAGALTNARYRTLEGQGHDIVPAVLAPVLEEFLLP